MGIKQLKQLRHLDVSNCRLTAWPLQLDALEQLQTLDLSHNLIDLVATKVEALSK